VESKLGGGHVFRSNGVWIGGIDEVVLFGDEVAGPDDGSAYGEWAHDELYGYTVGTQWGGARLIGGGGGVPVLISSWGAVLQ
jgi:hypothetical protein